MLFTKDVIIGLEIHVELNTNTKLFCSCPTKGSEEPNTRTCEICLGHPGSKPKINKKAIEYALKLAKALNCKISKEVIFSRKNYFYPDLAKNYQITQYEEPIGLNGFLKLENNKIGIERIHLEEDPASLVHPNGMQKSNLVFIDYNRSGNPLCEIVTKPEISSPQEAREFLKTLITILRYLEIFDPENNIIKADANISIKESGYIRNEIKNISGFKEIESALNYEIKRQKQAVENKQQLILETRSWDSKKQITFSLRKKETSEDYGYIFDPDLVPIEIKPFLQDLKIPKLPKERIKEYIKLKVAKDDAKIIANEFNLAEIFEKATKKINPILAAKWIRRELIRVANYNKIDTSEISINVNEFINLLELIQNKKITDKIGQKIIEELIIKDFDVKKYVKENNLESLNDSSTLENFCKEAIKENPKAVEDYKSGKKHALNFLLGQVMRKSKGKANPKNIKELLKKNI
jgi:aspartyl-tRNA(Asn)/glutamyl-tRNA(Gln) amidotransferase subunit B